MFDVVIRPLRLKFFLKKVFILNCKSTVFSRVRSPKILALITSDSEIISGDHRCFSSDSGLHINWKSLISSEKSIFQSSKIIAEQDVSVLISSETALNSADFSWIQDDIFQFNFQFFSKHCEVPQYRGTKFWFSAQLVIRMDQQKFIYSIFSQAKDITKILIYGFFHRAQVAKLKHERSWLFRKMLFSLSFCRIFGKFTFSFILGMPFWWPLHAFSSLSDNVITTYCSHLHLLILQLIQSWFSLKQRWNFQFWTALIQRNSELISSEKRQIFETALNRAEKRHISDTALFSAECL